MFDTVGRAYELMAAYDLSVIEFCRRSGIHHSTLTTTEKRNGQLSLDTVCRICEGLGITVAEFFMNPEEKKRYGVDWGRKAG